VITERMENVRSVALGFWIGTGSALESDEQAGLSHLLEHMLFRGAGAHSSREIDEAFDGMGAEINAGTDRETTSLYTRVLDRHLDQALGLMGEMVFAPRFEDLAAEREVVLEEIAMYEDDPQDRVFDLLGEAVFGAHPLGRPVIGRAEVVSAVREDGLRSFHDARYRSREIVVAAAGSVDHDRLVELVGGVCPPADGQAPSAAAAGTAHEPQFDRRVRFLAKETEQYHLCLGGRGLARGDERRFALRVLEGVLGASSSSRLFQEVREQRGLAYSVFCFSNLHAHAGEVGIYVGTRPDNLREASSTIAGELQRLVAGEGEGSITAAELDRSRENVKGRMVLALESTSARMSRLGSSLLAELPILSVDEIVQRLDAVTIADLQELAQELFACERLSIAGVGADQGLFEESLQAFEAVAS
jgi:predicted Zn-dependent peptidase